MYMAIIVEETVSGFHRETLWYGGDPENLASTILDVMDDWYKPNKELDKAIIRYHKMLEDKEHVTFKKLEGLGLETGRQISQSTADLQPDGNLLFRHERNLRDLREERRKGGGFPVTGGIPGAFPDVLRSG